MKKLIEMIKKSIYSPEGKTSSTRISAYIILGLIIFFTLVFLSIVIYDATQGRGISTEASIIFGMIMAHHLTLLGINKFHETKKQ